MTAADMERVRDGFVRGGAARRARRLRCHRTAWCARLSPAQLRLADLQQAQRRIRRRARGAHALSARGRARPCAPRCRRACRSVRASPATTGSTAGSRPDDAVAFAQALKEVGSRFRLHLLGRRQRRSAPHSGRQHSTSQFAEKVKREAGIATRAVGLIATPKQAEAIVADGKADMVALAACLARRSALGLARGANARRRGRPAEAVPARRAQGVGGRTPIATESLAAASSGAGSRCGHDHREAMVRKHAESSPMDAFVFAAVLFAAACHAGWNAAIKRGLDPLGDDGADLDRRGARGLAGLPAVDRLAGARSMALGAPPRC